MLKEQIGEKIKYFRSLKNLTQSELAEKINVSVETIYNCEAGRKLSLKTIENIANSLNIPIKEFFDFEIADNDNTLIKEINLICKNKSSKQLKCIIEMINLTEKYFK